MVETPGVNLDRAVTGPYGNHRIKRTNVRLVATQRNGPLSGITGDKFADAT